MIYLFILLLRLVAYLEGQAKIFSFIGVFLVMVYSIIKRVPLTRVNKVLKIHFYAFTLLLVIITHSLFYGNLVLRDFAVLIIYWAWFVFTFVYFKDKTTDQCLKYILVTFLIYNVSNYIFYDLYFSHEVRGINTILRFFGVDGVRVYFPLSSGANVFTSQLALNALISLYFIKNESRKLIYIVIYSFYIFMLIMADSRLILLFTMLFSAIYWFSLKTILYYFKKYWLLLSLMIIAVMYIFYSTSIFDEFKRPGEKTGAALSRIKIWKIAFQVIFDDFKMFIGHGLNGLENNLPTDSKEIFENQGLQTSHNFIIQSIIDFGFIGILIILVFVFKLLKMMLKLNSYIVTILIIMLLFMGGTESIPTFYSFEPTLFFIALVSIIIIHNEREVTESN